MVALENYAPMTPEVTRGLLEEIMPEKNKLEFEKRLDTDFAYELPGVGRFRVNVLMGRLGMGGVLRMIPSRVPTADELGLPKAVRDFCYLRKGLVVVTGPTGSGKSTTLAAMIDLINKTRSDHIITIEDPIEFVHVSQKCLITQREVHSHTESFANALRAALREDPDIVLVGEMRDLETMEIAIETAETGHLVFGTLHTNTAATTVNRIIDKFPANRQNQIRSMLADSLKGVVAQTLCKKIPKGRVAAMEILAITTGVASNIREGNTHQIASAMQTGRRQGMQTFNDALLNLVTDGLITSQEAYTRSLDRENLGKQMQTAGLSLDFAEGEGAQAKAAPPSEGGTSAKPQPIEDTVAQLRESLKQAPENVAALNNLAWILATTQDAKLRNAKEAVGTAEKAHFLAPKSSPQLLDTLAAAYAAAGRYDSAIKWAQESLNLARSSGQTEFAETVEQRLAMYEKGAPIIAIFSESTQTKEGAGTATEEMGR
jgi:twitching motility protein PilT